MPIARLATWSPARATASFPSAPIGVDTWLTDCLATASRMLRAEAEETAALTAAWGSLVDAVSWESASARAFRDAAAQTRTSVVVLGQHLEQLHHDAARLHRRARWGM